MITNVVACTSLHCDIDLKKLVLSQSNIVYNPRSFSSVMWRSKKIGGLCMVFANGRMMVNGKVKTVKQCKKRVRQYARMLQKSGWNVRLGTIRIATISASFKLETEINFPDIVNQYGGCYEPERFPANMFTKDTVHFSVFGSGTVLMTGLKKESDVDRICMPILLELCFCNNMLNC